MLKYPLVNGPGTFYGERMLALATQLESRAVPPRRIAAYTVSTIRKFVKLGFGIGIVPRHASVDSHDPEIHERSMTKYLGQIPTNVVTRRVARSALAESFVQIVRQMLNRNNEVRAAM
jgi:DNA-binding transcriptional LysR family regulator